jgi:hypothetical protein
MEIRRRKAWAAYLSLAPNGEIIGERAVGDPLLRTVDDPVLPVFGLDRSGLQSSDVAARKSVVTRPSVTVFISTI